MVKNILSYLYVNKETIIHGIKSGFSIAMSIFTVSLTFGIYASSNAINPIAAIFMSFLVFAGASQFLGIQLYLAGASFWEIIISTFIINIRHFLMSTALSQKIKKEMNKTFSFLIPFGITDASFALLYFNEPQNFLPSYILAVQIFSHFSWVLGTIFGVIFGEYLPSSLKNTIGIAIYALFIGFLIPEIKKSKTGFVISLIAICINVFLYYTLSFHHLTSGWRFIISALAATSIGLVVFPEEEENKN